MIVLAAAAAMATFIIEPENFSRMMISSCRAAKSMMTSNLVWMVAFFGIAYPGTQVSGHDSGVVAESAVS
jgi:hypothetical protein